jgi:hypothetical protein
MRRISWFSSVTGLLATSAFSVIVGCASGEMSEDDSRIAQNLKEQAACQINDGTVDPDDDVRACEPGNTKKTTICHVPPGNPANAHTLCIGNAAVKHHLANHPDYLGPCKREVTCPPAVDGGTPNLGGAGGSGAGGVTGSGGAPAGSGGAPAGSGGTGGVVVIVE